MDNFSDEEAGVDELKPTFGIEDDEHLRTENETQKQICRPRGPTIMFDVTALEVWERRRW